MPRPPARTAANTENPDATKPTRASAAPEALALSSSDCMRSATAARAGLAGTSYTQVGVPVKGGADKEMV